MITPDGEHSPSAQQIEVSLAPVVEQVLACAAPVCAIEAYRFQHANHLLVEISSMQRVALRFSLREEIRDVATHC